MVREKGSAYRRRSCLTSRDCVARVASLLEISLAERRAAAAFPFLRKHHFKSERFQNLHRRDTDVRLVIAHEGVVPENDLASVAAVYDRRLFAAL